MSVKSNIKNIAIVGVGGIGSWFIHFLYDFGYLRKQLPIINWNIDIYDPDIVDEKNLLHQNFNVKHLGKSKVEILGDKYPIVNPVQREMGNEDFKNYDVIICCVDNMKFRKDLMSYGAANKQLYWIDGRCQSRAIQVFTSQSPSILDNIKDPLEITSEDSVQGGCLREIDKNNNTAHATPVIIAAIMLQQLLNYYRNESSNNWEISLYL